MLGNGLLGQLHGLLHRLSRPPRKPRGAEVGAGAASWELPSLLVLVLGFHRSRPLPHDLPEDCVDAEAAGADTAGTEEVEGC